jgi:LysR family transcriptional regulator, glycine cleavage system transcriptional activator
VKFRRLPPLHTLEAFEHAARGASFKAAAQQLHLTPSAVSHQIKALEEFLGFSLFRRGNRSLELSAGGKAYLAVVQETLRQLREGSGRVTERFGRAALKISMGPFIASEIVVPALPEFQEKHPHIDLHISTSLRPVDLLHEDIDIALRFGSGRWPRITAHLLLEVDAIPVCDPATARKLRRRTPEQLDDVSLIHSSAMPNAWSLWSQIAGAPLGKPRRDLWLDSYFSMVRAAEEGGGLTLGLFPIVNPWISQKRLVTPWPQLKARIPQAYYLLHRRNDARRAEVNAFREWLTELLRKGIRLRRAPA